jgi:hypothetical protein
VQQCELVRVDQAQVEARDLVGLAPRLKRHDQRSLLGHEHLVPVVAVPVAAVAGERTVERSHEAQRNRSLRGRVGIGHGARARGEKEEEE